MPDTVAAARAAIIAADVPVNGTLPEVVPMRARRMRLLP